MWPLVLVPVHGHCYHYQWKASVVIWFSRSAIVDGTKFRLTNLSESQDKKPVRWSTVGTAKNERLQLLSLVIIPSSPTSRISIFQSGWRRKKEIGILWVWINPRTRCYCFCCYEWSLGKMKPVVADKLAVSLLRVERGDDTPLFFLCSKEPGGRQIDDYLTGINVCPHWIHDVSTDNTKQKQ